jgi:hypothetical protein
MTAIYEIMWKNTAEHGRPQMTICACTLHAGCLRLQIQTLRLHNTHPLSTTTMATRTRLNVTLHIHHLPYFLSSTYTHITIIPRAEVTNKSACF